jgi:nucleoside 2-deoxyribosyltransferase
MKIYLAGPIPTQNNWRDIISKKISQINSDVTIYNPENFENTYSPATIVNYDKSIIKNCDLLIANITRLSAGTSMEILYAWERDIPVLLIANKEIKNPWLIYHSSFIVKNLKEAIDVFENNF